MVLGDDVDGGYVTDGRLIQGLTGNLGQFGHLVVEPEGTECVCGARGCLTMYAGARGIEASTSRELRRTPAAIVERTGIMVARACATIGAMLDVTEIVLGGVVPSVMGEPFFEALARELDQRSGLAHLEHMRVRGVSTGRIGPLVAAAAVAAPARRRAAVDVRRRASSAARSRRIRRRGTLAGMRPTYSAEADAYRQKVQAFLAEQLPAGWAGIGALDGDELTQFVTEWRATLYERRVPRARLAGRVRRRRTDRARAGDPRRGVRQGGRADRWPERRVQHPDARQHPAAAGHRRAEGALPAPHPARRRHLVPGLQRAERRLRPVERRPPGRARRRPVGAQRPEDLDVGRPPRRPHLHPRPHRPRRPEAQGHLVPARRHATAGHRGAPDQDDLGRERVQRGLLHRRRVPEGQRRRRRRTTAGGWR